MAASATVLAAPPSKPVSAIVRRPCSRAHVSACTMFGERPDDETAMRASPGLDCDWSWYTKTFSYPRSLAIALSNSTLVLRLITRGVRSVAVRTPLTWSHCRWLAIDAEPPLPHEKTAAPRV